MKLDLHNSPNRYKMLKEIKKFALHASKANFFMKDRYITYRRSAYSLCEPRTSSRTSTLGLTRMPVSVSWYS